MPGTARGTAAEQMSAADDPGSSSRNTRFVRSRMMSGSSASERVPAARERRCDRQPDRLTGGEIDRTTVFADEKAIAYERHARTAPRQCKKTAERKRAGIAARRGACHADGAESSYMIDAACCGFSPPANRTAVRSSSFSKDCQRDSASTSTQSRATCGAAREATDADAAWRSSP